MKLCEKRNCFRSSSNFFFFSILFVSFVLPLNSFSIRREIVCDWSKPNSNLPISIDLEHLYFSFLCGLRRFSFEPEESRLVAYGSCTVDMTEAIAAAQCSSFIINTCAHTIFDLTFFLFFSFFFGFLGFFFLSFFLVACCLHSFRFANQLNMIFLAYFCVLLNFFLFLLRSLVSDAFRHTASARTHRERTRTNEKNLHSKAHSRHHLF